MGSDVASVNLAALAAVGIVGLLGPLSATAQVQPPGDFRKTDRVHIGPRYMTPAIDLKEFGVDSNVFNTTDQPESDFVVTVTPRAALWIPVGQRLIWQANTSGDFVYFATHASERSINPRSAHGRRCCRSDSRSSAKGRTKIRGSARTSRSMRGRVARKRAAPASEPT